MEQQIAKEALNIIDVITAGGGSGVGVVGLYLLFDKFVVKKNGNSPISKAECKEKLARQDALNEKIFEKLEKISEDIGYIKGKIA